MKNKVDRIKMFIMDVDGTLTDGKLYIGEQGEVFKAFNVKDGYGIKLLNEYKIIPVIITGRKSNIVLERAKELNIKEVFQGVINKIEVFEHLKSKYSLNDEEIAFIGDDLNDFKLMQRVGLKFTVANCTDELTKIVDYKSHLNGGSGAVRDVINIIINYKKTQTVME